MIKNIRLLHYLSEETYMNINRALIAAGGSQRTETHVDFDADNNSIYKVNTFNIVYEAFGHI